MVEVRRAKAANQTKMTDLTSNPRSHPTSKPSAQPSTSGSITTSYQPHHNPKPRRTSPKPAIRAGSRVRTRLLCGATLHNTAGRPPRQLALGAGVVDREGSIARWDCKRRASWGCTVGRRIWMMRCWWSRWMSWGRGFRGAFGRDYPRETARCNPCRGSGEEEVLFIGVLAFLSVRCARYELDELLEHHLVRDNSLNAKIDTLDLG